ncbi:MAG: hypothetical protein M3N97_01420 [Pseudomonadota bacterium]|nr:hypothetical protein [Pseudomonadota bacterium]
MSLRMVGLALWFFCAAACPQQACLAAADKAVPASVKRDAARCLNLREVDACNDAIRRNPNDAELLVALADGLVRAQRPADALRHYRRAATLAPTMRGLSAKISALEKRRGSAQAPTVARRSGHPASRVPTGSLIGRAASNDEPDKRYSNAEPETQSH